MIFPISRPAASRPSSCSRKTIFAAATPTATCVRDSRGNPVLECMCGNVLCGRFDPALPFFTPKGSFWTNGTSELLASTSEADRQARTRNRCNGEGYESVALIALRHGGETLGLLQLNDRAKGRFTPEDDRLPGTRRRPDRHGPGATSSPRRLADERGAIPKPFSWFADPASGGGLQRGQEILRQLRAAGVTDFRQYFQSRPEAVRTCAAKVKILGVNQASLDLHQATSQRSFLPVCT